MDSNVTRSEDRSRHPVRCARSIAAGLDNLHDYIQIRCVPLCPSCPVKVVRNHVLQQPLRPFSCTGGQGTLPQEQNTQQSPGLGLRSAPQPVHS